MAKGKFGGERWRVSITTSPRMGEVNRADFDFYKAEHFLNTVNELTAQMARGADLVFTVTELDDPLYGN